MEIVVQSGRRYPAAKTPKGLHRVCLNGEWLFATPVWPGRELVAQSVIGETAQMEPALKDTRVACFPGGLRFVGAPVELGRALLLVRKTGPSTVEAVALTPRVTAIKL